MQAGDYIRNFDIGVLPGDDPSLAGKIANANRVLPQFYMMPVVNEKKTAEAGVAKHDMIEMVQFIIPGDKHSSPERRVRPTDKVLYRGQYEAFRKGEEYAQEGTALESWPMLNRAKVMDLKSMGIFTVEHLSNLSDSQMQNIGMGARMLVKHAKAFLETAATGKVPAALVAENQSLRNQVTLLTEQMGQLMSRVESMVRKSGGNAADLPDVISDARVAVSKAVGVKEDIRIPDDYTRLTFSKLKDVCAEFSAASPRNKDECLELIVEYQGKQAALA